MDFYFFPFICSQRGTLHDELIRRESRKDPFSESMVLNTFFQICEGVLYLHNLQPEPIAHRDLKPHNLLLDDDLTPIIMDLGKMFLTLKHNSSFQLIFKIFYRLGCLEKVKMSLLYSFKIKFSCLIQVP